jgi:hypothetical protein
MTEDITRYVRSQLKFALDYLAARLRQRIMNYANGSADSDGYASNRKIDQFDGVENFSLMSLKFQVFGNLQRTTRIS